MTTDQKKWEDLTVYRPLTKEALKPAYKDFTKIVADNLSHFGFKLQGRKLIKLSNDILHIIHLDTRGSWMGLNDTFKIEIALVPVYDFDPFINGLELTGSKEIQEIIPKLKNYYRITQEYKLLADFITRKLIDYILPYFDKYSSCAKILSDRRHFPLDNVGIMAQRNGNLILFSELINHIDKEASDLVSKRIEFYTRLHPEGGKLPEYYLEYENYTRFLKVKDWNSIDKILFDKKDAVLKKLKLNASR